MVLGAASGKERFAAATALLDYGFANYESAAAALPPDAPQTLAVTHGTAAMVPLQYETPQRCLVPKGQGGALSVTVQLPETLEAPVQAGAQVGTVMLQNGGQTVGQYAVRAGGDVEALRMGYCFGLLARSLALASV